MGGMGEVCRATDNNLARQVAIKALAETVAGDAERPARFDREPKTLAALNHPHIAAIYGVERTAGTTALVMELIEGPTLADRLVQASIPVDEALAIATQIAEALEAAHPSRSETGQREGARRRHGQSAGLGLAKAIEPVGVMSPSHSMSPTVTTPAMTQAGVILGTAAYMALEQARGRPTDKASRHPAGDCSAARIIGCHRARRETRGTVSFIELCGLLDRTPGRSRP
jgi:eukaryotic-like serine/threonine-protein kinase